ncbi:hypothetical protein ABLE93_11700 [Xanthobacter sp. KR7-65]|uniref:hypothetical protein n=1 Tax=Xanthobacter sp. KR7-65 TaxID=3156612 RepID=UPI0032B5E123
MADVPAFRSSGARSSGARFAGALVPALALLALASPASAQSCLEQIVPVQTALKERLPHPKKPPEQEQSVAAQTDRQPTPGSLAAAGLTPTDDGAWGALNQAINLQAAGDEAGCLKALAEARRLGGLK